MRYLLQGSVRKGADRLKMSAQLVEVENGSHLWAEKYDGAVEDVFDLQDQITADVVGAIEPSIRRAEIDRTRRKRPENLDAYDLYLRALPAAWAFAPEETGKAIELLHSALRLDPGYAAAHSLAAFCHLRGFAWGELNDTEKATAIRHARTVLLTDTDDATAPAFSGLVVGFLERDFNIGCSAIENAVALNPNSAQAFGLGAALYSFVGSFDTVVDYANRSLRLSPFDRLRFIALNALSRAHFLCGRYEEAIEAALRVTQANPRFAPGYVWLVASHMRLGRTAQALETKERLLQADANFRFARWTGFVIASPEHQDTIARPLKEAGLPS